MNRLDAITIVGDSLYYLVKWHGARIITVNGEKMIQVSHTKGFDEKYTYGRIGDKVAYYNNTNVCVPKDIYEEFADGWINNEWGDRTEPFVEYYEIFADEHADKLVQEPRKIKIENALLKHWFVNAILLGLSATGLMILISEVWTSIIH